MEDFEVFSRLQRAYELSGCTGFGQFVASCASHYGKDVRLLDNPDLVEHAECYSRFLRDRGNSSTNAGAR